MTGRLKGVDGVERRFHTCEDIEVRVAGDNNPAVLVGYAAVFNELSEDLGGFREQVAPGAFSKTLGGDIRALVNHEPDLIIGRTRSGTLTLSEDQRGLRVEITLPDTSVARDLMESVKVGNINQMSFGFRKKADTWENIDGEVVRTLVEVELLDVSPVTFPAYPQTEIAKRSMAAWEAERAPVVPDYSAERRKLDLLAL